MLERIVEISNDKSHLSMYRGFMQVHTAGWDHASSLVDWEMSSDRNSGEHPDIRIASLVDWEMSSDRNDVLTFI